MPHSIEQTLGVKITTRDGWIKLDGSDEAVHRAKQVFQLLELEGRPQLAQPQVGLDTRQR